jgi:hypothetical protein
MKKLAWSLIALAAACGSSPANRAARDAAHFDPNSVSEDRLRDVRADFGIYVPSMAPTCPEDPVTKIRCVGDNGATARGLAKGLVFTWSVYPPEQRKQFLDAYTDGLLPNGHKRDYTHLPIGPFTPCTGRRSYHGIYPEGPCTVGAINALLHEMWDHQVDGRPRPVIPIVFTIADDDTDVHLPEGVDKSLIRMVAGKWEHPTADCDLQKVRAAFPHALLYWHTPVDKLSPDGDSCYPQTEGRAWYRHAREAYRLTGVLKQTTPWDRDVEKRVSELRATADLMGPDLDLILFETDIYVKFWDGLSEKDSLAYNDAILTRESLRGAIRGFGSGSSIPRTP